MNYFISPHFLLLKEHEKHLRAVCRVHLPSNMTSRLIGMKENVTLDYNCPLRVLSLMLLLLCSATSWGKTQRRALLSTGAVLNEWSCTEWLGLNLTKSRPKKSFPRKSCSTHKYFRSDNTGCPAQRKSTQAIREQYDMHLAGRGMRGSPAISVAGCACKGIGSVTLCECWEGEWFSFFLFFKEGEGIARKCVQINVKEWWFLV